MLASAASLRRSSSTADPWSLALSSVLTESRVVLISFSKKVWQLDLDTLKYSALSPLPEEAPVDLLIGAGGENKLEGPHRRSQWTFIGRFVQK